MFSRGRFEWVYGAAMLVLWSGAAMGCDWSLGAALGLTALRATAVWRRIGRASRHTLTPAAGEQSGMLAGRQAIAAM